MPGGKSAAPEPRDLTRVFPRATASQGEVMVEELTRILLGTEETAKAAFYLEVVFRTTVMYIYTVFLARMVGQGGLGQLGPFEFVLVIAVGSAAGDPMFYPDIGLLQGILVITVVIVLHRLMAFVLARHHRIEAAIEGEALLVVEDGRIRDEALGSGTITKRELLSLLRLSGVRDVGQVELAFLEPQGRLSVFRYQQEAAKERQSTLPPQEVSRRSR